jgi:hypothetical protein
MTQPNQDAAKRSHAANEIALRMLFKPGRVLVENLKILTRFQPFLCIQVSVDRSEPIKK